MEQPNGTSFHLYDKSSSVNIQLEEEEELEEQRRREEELHDLLENAFDDFSHDESTIASTNISVDAVHPSVDPSKSITDDRCTKGDGAGDGKYSSNNSFTQLKCLYEIRLREIDQLKTEYDEFQNETKQVIDELHKKLMVMESEKNDFIAAERRLRLSVNKQTEELEHLRNECETFKKALEREKEEKEDLKLGLTAQAAEMKAKIRALENGLLGNPPSVNETHTHCENKISKLEELNRVLSSQIEKKSSDMKTIRNELHSLDLDKEVELKKKEDTIRELNIQLSDIRKESQSYFSTVAYLSYENQRLQDLLRKDNNQQGSSVDGASLNKILQSELQKSLSSQQEKRGEILKLQKDLEDALKKVEEYSKQNLILEDRIMKLEGSHQKGLGQAENNKNKSMRSVASVGVQADCHDAREEDIRLLKAQLEHLEERCALLSQELAIKAEKDDAIENLQSKARELEDFLKAQQPRPLHADMKDIGTMTDDVTSDLHVLKNEYEKDMHTVEATLAASYQKEYESKITEIERLLKVKYDNINRKILTVIAESEAKDAEMKNLRDELATLRAGSEKNIKEFMQEWNNDMQLLRNELEDHKKKNYELATLRAGSEKNIKEFMQEWNNDMQLLRNELEDHKKKNYELTALVKDYKKKEDCYESYQSEIRQNRIIIDSLKRQLDGTKRSVEYYKLHADAVEKNFKQNMDQNKAKVVQVLESISKRIDDTLSFRFNQWNVEIDSATANFDRKIAEIKRKAA